jgi:hypothetical protein
LVPDTSANTHDGQRRTPHSRSDIRAQLTGSFANVGQQVFAQPLIVWTGRCWWWREAALDSADHIQSFWQTTTARMISPLVADLKPGVFNAPLRGCGALTSATSGEAGIHVGDAQ